MLSEILMYTVYTYKLSIYTKIIILYIYFFFKSMCIICDLRLQCLYTVFNSTKQKQIKVKIIVKARKLRIIYNVDLMEPDV